MNKKTIGILVAIPLLIGLIFFENIYGYFRFQWYCSNEGGLKVYEQVERDKVWISEHSSAARFMALQDYVGFSLYKDKGGNLVNVIYKGGNSGSSKSYEFVPYDAEEESRYEYKYSYERFRKDKEIRLYKSDYIVVDKTSGKPSIQLVTFYYKFFDEDNVPFGRSSGTGCRAQSKWPWRDFVAAIDRNLKE